MTNNVGLTSFRKKFSEKPYFYTNKNYKNYKNYTKR